MNEKAHTHTHINIRHLSFHIMMPLNIIISFLMAWLIFLFSFNLFMMSEYYFKTRINILFCVEQWIKKNPFIDWYY